MIFKGNNFKEIFKACDDVKNHVSNEIIIVEEFGKNRDLLLLILHKNELWGLSVLNPKKTRFFRGSNIKELLLKVYDFNTNWTEEELKENIMSLRAISMIELQNFYCHWKGLLLNGIIIDTLTDDEELIRMYNYEIKRLDIKVQKKRYLQMIYHGGLTKVNYFDKSEIYKYLFVDEIVDLILHDEDFFLTLKNNFPFIAEQLFA